jgi:hypothetical protein
LPWPALIHVGSPQPFDNTICSSFTIAAPWLFDCFFPSDDLGANITYWEANANLVYRFNSVGKSATAYIGSGLNFAYTKLSINALGGEVSGSDTRGGLNLLGGIIFEVGGLNPYLEARFELGGGEQFRATVGLRL